ncbi:LD-carboxypeptidase [Mucilaginibacter sp. HMF5004]|uniref:S66 peptidase family protein n=1 Tax=Mucilaginibacter rivuli TaxID=2857527 RepID=UPI001C60079B|nr:LD-carboxypeptidase [Mucilaginibacter rivuli]MBW4890037.1 LD-carboxypeptidase [Mucilaginibacter rivuli]
MTGKNHPPYLKPGDKIAITCPAKKLPKPMTDAVALLESWGLEVVLGETVTASFHQFAGDDALRARDMQRFLDDNSIKAIFAARGGYGTIRIIDDLDFTDFAKNPKWLVGFSDITVLHSHIWANHALQSIHGQMPITIPDASATSLKTLKNALFGENIEYDFRSHSENRPGEAEGILIGGNLSLLIAMLGSASDFSYDNKILFIEDVGEYLYSTDRMLRTLKRAGKLTNLAGLMVGGFTEVKDNDIPFGQTIQQIVMEVVKDYNYPVCFDFPAGHIPDNRALILGRDLHFKVETHYTHAKYI